MESTLTSDTFLTLPAAPAPFTQLRRTLAADVLKLRRTAALRLTLVSGALPVLLTFCIFFFKGYIILKAGGTPWPRFISTAWQTAGTLLLPLFVVLLTSLVVHIETKATAWKHLYAQPVGRGAVFGSKLLLILVLNAVALLLFAGLVLGAGVLLGVLKPKLGFQTYSIPLPAVAWMLLRTYVATLGLLAVQYIVSLYWRSFVVPVGVGMGAVVSVIALMQWEHANKIPYAAPFFTAVSMKMGKGSLEVAHALAKHEWYSLGWFAGVLVVGYLLLYRRNVTN
ncbi:ABC transporter permease [Hymenobacter sp. BT186]|uniref:ABC transporter permease n=1 Tax=Hymenobacter telluris TaxID=2816474 RepID=A0A939JBS6_9BACT|nr:ABC transporter permease [Hymenobacter telluris]MBO0357088.1 ABC transporter permease [Hymenobacter telluris]MBW3373115.1 ABC transporter permease [Hymenobacter norwichensis]